MARRGGTRPLRPPRGPLVERLAGAERERPPPSSRSPTPRPPCAPPTPSGTPGPPDRGAEPRPRRRPVPRRGRAPGGVDGVVGTLLDLVEIDPGWEAAVEARPARRWPPWSSMASTPPARVGGAPRRRRRRGRAVLALGAHRAPRRRRRSASPCAVTSELPTPTSSALLDALLGGAVAVDGAGRRRSTSPWHRTPPSSPRRAIDTARPAGARTPSAGATGPR